MRKSDGGCEGWPPLDKVELLAKNQVLIDLQRPRSMRLLGIAERTKRCFVIEVATRLASELQLKPLNLLYQGFVDSRTHRGAASSGEGLRWLTALKVETKPSANVAYGRIVESAVQLGIAWIGKSYVIELGRCQPIVPDRFIRIAAEQMAKRDVAVDRIKRPVL